jgi:hypothetical protein
MSFTINRNINFKAIKKTINISNTININSLKESLGSTGSSDFLSINTLSINNNLINASAEELNYLQVTPGIAQALKGLIVDSSRNITNINTISCNSIRINGDLITSNNDLNGGSSDDLNNPYLTNIVPGIGQANKALVLDSTKNIKNINNLTTNELMLENTNINIYDNNNIYIDDISNKINTQRTILNKSYISSSIIPSNYSDNAAFSNTSFNDITWSPDLELFVIVGSATRSWDNAYSKIHVSNNSYEWISPNHPNQTTNYTSTLWSTILKMFFVISDSVLLGSYDGFTWFSINLPDSFSSPSILELNNILVIFGGSNKIAISQDGLNWKMVNNINNNDIWHMTWANSLNLYIAVSASGSDSNKIYISDNCINWIDIKMNYYTTSNQGFTTIEWSEELNILVAGATNNVFYSYDAVTWNICPQVDGGFPTFDRIIWNSFLKAFIGLREDQAFFYISYNGIYWYKYNSFSTSNGVKRAVWSEKLGMLVLLRSNRLYQLYLNQNKRNVSSNLVTIDYNTYNTGINKLNPQSTLEINDTEGKCLKIYNHSAYSYDISNNTTSYFGSFDILDNGQLNITSCRYYNSDPRSVSITINNNQVGLKLNNILLTPSITEYNYIKNITLGTGIANKVLSADSNRNISNINNLSCNSLLINNNSINSETYNSNLYLQNNIFGKALASKALLTDINKNISDLNNIGCNNLIFNKYNKIITNNQNENIKINKLKQKNIEKHSILSLFNNSKWGTKSTSLYTSSSFYDICWSPELNIFVAVGNNIVTTSSDGINWTLQYTAINGNVWESICWSPELSLFVAVSSGQNYYNIMTSPDGITWTLRFNPLSDLAFKKVIWISNLQIFLAVSSTGSTARAIISRDGENWARSFLSTSYNWISISWINHLNLIVVVSSNSTIIGTSSNGITWNYTTPPTTDLTSGYNSIVYAKDLNLIIAAEGWRMYYSYDAINWYYYYLSEYSPKMYWISDLNIFISLHSTNFTYSYDGFNWNRCFNFTGNLLNNGYMALEWSSYLGMFVSVAINGTNRIIYSDSLSLLNTKNNLYSHKSQFYLNKLNGNLGLGTINPNYQLELSTDNAKKPSTTTWTIVSDQRLKDNIENADLDICYNVIKNLPLKKYKWKNNIFKENQIKDTNKLGWIANEVEQYFPKAIIEKNIYNIEECKTLNIDQIVATIYGCTQKIINNYENLDFNHEDLLNKLNNIENFLNTI